MCEVEIDPDTGALDIVRYTVVEDIGNVINPTLAQGQIHGGVAQGVAQAIGEIIIYDAESGQLATGSFIAPMCICGPVRVVGFRPNALSAFHERCSHLG